MVEYLLNGGVFLGLIIAFSIWTLSLIIERISFYIHLSKGFKKILSHPNLEGIKSELATSHFWGKDYCVNLLNLVEKKKPYQEVETLCQEIVEQYAYKTSIHLSLINTLAGLQPLLGLLGTITGMIITFTVISKFGSGDPKLLAKGISQAMITTQAGLCATIPIVLCHRFLVNRSKVIMMQVKKIIKIMAKNYL